MLTYLMVARVAQLCPGAVLTKLDKLVEPLKLTVTTKVSLSIINGSYPEFGYIYIRELAYFHPFLFLGQGKFC